MRRFVIGDIHGCAKALRTLIEQITPQDQDEIIFLGDYIDRGPDSRDVVNQVLELQGRCRLVTLRGNHEIMLQGVALGGLDDTVWLCNGGSATVTSYGGSLNKIPEDHLRFFQRLLPFYETSSEIFVHAGYDHEQTLSEQEDLLTYWTHLSFPLPPPHPSGKRVFVGHTPQPYGEILDAGHLVCVDTNCFGGGYLTAMEVGSNNLIQVDRHGHIRRAPLAALADRTKRLGLKAASMYRKQFSRKCDNKGDEGPSLAKESKP